jgi:excisionase family DNA binding protein
MLTARAVAELLGVHPNWVYVHAASGEVPGYRVGGALRFRRCEIERWLETRRSTAAREVASCPPGC